MDKRVEQHYERRPECVRNSANDNPVNISDIYEPYIIQQDVGTVCTGRVVSVTIYVDE